MLVLTRFAGESLFIGGENESIVTVAHLLPDRLAVTLRITQATANTPGRLAMRTVDVKLDETVKVDERSQVVLVDVRGDKARLGVITPAAYSVHRLEMYEELLRTTGAARQDGPDDLEDGLAGSPVPKPPGPVPPSLDVRLDEPRAGDEV